MSCLMSGLASLEMLFVQSQWVQRDATRGERKFGERLHLVQSECHYRGLMWWCGECMFGRVHVVVWKVAMCQWELGVVESPANWFLVCKRLRVVCP